MKLLNPLNVASAIFIALFVWMIIDSGHAEERAAQERIERQEQMSLPDLINEIEAKCPITGTDYDPDKQKSTYGSKTFCLHHISLYDNGDSIYVILGDDQIFTSLDRNHWNEEVAAEQVVRDLSCFSNLKALMPKLYEQEITMICIVTDRENALGGGHKVEYHF